MKVAYAGDLTPILQPTAQGTGYNLKRRKHPRPKTLHERSLAHLRLGRLARARAHAPRTVCATSEAEAGAVTVGPLQSFVGPTTHPPSTLWDLAVLLRPFGFGPLQMCTSYNLIVPRTSKAVLERQPRLLRKLIYRTHRAVYGFRLT